MPMPSPRVLVCILLLAACSDNNNNVTNDGGVTPVSDAALGDVSTTGLPTDGGAVDAAAADAAAAAPTFTQVYAIITSMCSPCHTTTTAGNIGITLGHLDMTTQANAYMNLVNAPTMGVACTGAGTRVTPGDPDKSIMYLKVSLDDPTPCGAKMPFQRAPLSQDQADTIENWIKAGAMNN